jgi:predicted CXXCH cytochrome family protein
MGTVCNFDSGTFMAQSRIVILCIICLLGWGAFAVWINSSKTVPLTPSIVALPEPTTAYPSRHRNTAGAERIGSDRCIDCHKPQGESFSATAHARSLQRIRIEEEPPDGEFVHAASGRKYRIDRDGDRLWHRELYLDSISEQIAAAEHPVTWRIGSGHHSRSYLIDMDGYLFESPLTWYSSSEAWGMSPGFDHPNHEGFSRAAHDGCVECHSGQIESTGNSTHQLNMIEPSIGCENCHGPGSIHVKERTAELAFDAEYDDTIVNPRKISRARNEDICARCHLRGAGWAFVRGRDLSEFRPGLPLSDYRVDFVRKQSSEQMEVVGHFEQMHASRCYTQSESLTCTTCHNPHESPAASAKVEYYRRACIQCHDTDSSACAVPESKRRMQSPEDDCASCHMPKSETEIPHFTFTHHRISIEHAPPQPQRKQDIQSVELIPFGDVSRLAPLDLQRCLGVALARPEKNMGPLALEQALKNLQEVERHGMRDAEVLGGLAYVYWAQDNPNCLKYAEQALEAQDCDAETRIDLLIVLGDMQLRQGAFSKAEQAFEELTQIRPRYTDWQMLGVCRSLQNRPSEAIAAFQKAIELQPGSIDVHSLLADELEKIGSLELSVQQRKIAARLEQVRPRRINSH